MGTFSVPSRGGGSRATARCGGGAAGCWRTGHGDHRPTIFYAIYSYTLHHILINNKANFSRTGSLCPVLQHPTIIKNLGNFCKVTIYHFLLSFSYTFHCWYLWFVKPWVSGCETKVFRVWNHGFQEVKPRLSDCNFIGFFVVSLWLFGRLSTGVLQCL